MFFDGVRYLASGSGDKTVRLWDVNTETPQFTCEGMVQDSLKIIPAMK